VKDRCTGIATSTLGGGGGTKVFCSQALKTAVATIAKPARRIAALLCAALTDDLKRAGERETFIFRASIGFVLEKAYSEIGFPPPHENSNNPLAAEPERENDAARFF
jgi:xanthine dehydrogenase molybdopterin-binding subunit B